jgi:fibronectin-binding autotransporter adhesin
MGKMRKNKALTVIAAAAFAATANMALADTDLFSTLGDFAGSSFVVNSAGQGFVGSNIDSSFGNLGVLPTASSLAAGQEVGNEGWGLYDGSGNIEHSNGTTSATSTDNKDDTVAFLPTSLGNASPATNGIGHFANDLESAKDLFDDGYPTSPTVAPALPTVAAPFNANGTDPYLGRSYAGITGKTGSIVVENYQPFNGGEGPGTVQISSGEMVVPNTTFPGAAAAAPAGNSAATTAFLNSIANSHAIAIDFTAPGGGTTLNSNGTGSPGYDLLSFSTSDSSTTTSTTKAGGFNTMQYDWVNPSSTLSSKDVGSSGDQPGSFVVSHGTGAASYWTAYIPYGYSAAASVSFLQFQLNLDMDRYVGGNITIDNIRTVSPQWAASGSGLSWDSGGSLTPDTDEIQGTNGTTITSNVNSEEELLTGATSASAGNWIGVASTYVPTTFTGPDADMNGVTQSYGLGVPSGSGASVTFGDLETGNATIGLDSNQTVGTLIFNSTGDNTSGLPLQYNLTASSSTIFGIGAGGSLIMDNTVNSAPAAINFIAGATIQFITAPVILHSNTVITVTSAANTLFFGSQVNALGNVVGGISGTGSLTIAGAGTVQLFFLDTYSGGTTVNAGANLLASTDNALPSGHALVNNGTTTINGDANLSSLTGTGKLSIGPGGDLISTVQLAMNSGLATESGLTIAANSALDITNNHLILTYAPGTQTTVDTTIRGYLKNGFNGGTWNGTSGINSSIAALPANNHYGVGYADGADNVVSGLASGQIEVKYALLGDTNLDGIVSGEDFTILVSHLGKSVSNWDQGDFFYTGTVNGTDFTALVINLGKQANGADITLPAADLAAIDAFAAANGLMADVPEPASAGIACLAGAGLLLRRRKLSGCKSACGE